MAPLGPRLVLASQSPRRRELLARLGHRDFVVCPADVDETLAPGTPPDRAVEELSRKKALALSLPEDRVILAADTVVALDGKILGKPRDEAEAFSMLRMLSGRTHTVYTGVTAARGGRARTGHESTEVEFLPLTDGEIRAYIATGEPTDKAGAYGIQERGALLVRAIRGDYFNVVGLPLRLAAQLLREFDFAL